MVDVLVYGAGGLGRVVLDILRQGREFRAIAFLDSDPMLHGTVVDGLRVLGGVEAVEGLRNGRSLGAVVAVGDNFTRVALAERIECAGLRLVSAIHPLATVSPTARLERHLIIGPRVTICVHAHVGPHTVLCPGAIVEHDNVIGRGAFLYPAVRLAGTVSIGDFATIGIGACVIPGRRVGREARIAPGAVVIHDVAPGVRVGGVPAVRCAEPDGHFIPEPTADARPLLSPALP